ncbi:ABC transporter ATP-binding protein [Spartinivicinus ruber]|uniref:ABC transporter ATP-binding protein n=1 Tax=Spartinivicinus ruber TaxID=2683272 RepID=UPI001E3E3000|nr:ABC transporter ATP-binding protein [Spartinivicinus ruber]
MMLEVNQLTRCYGSFKAVDNVSFTIGKGEIVGLLGHNGAGKTTIMKMLSGYLEPNQGVIKIDGVDLQLDPKRVQQSLGYLPENLPVYPEMTVADYLDYAAEIKGLTNNHKIAEIKRAIQATDIDRKLLDPIATLSRGYKQRVGVAQAILGQPKLLILDEPTNGLDPTQTDHMRQLIREIAKNATVILSTHIMQEVDAICDRALIIRHGQLAVDAKLETLHSSSYLRLVTSMGSKQAKTLLGALPSLKNVEAIEQQPSETVKTPVIHYRLQLAEGRNPLEVSAVVAKQIIAAKAELYALTAEHRDLETLFREVNESSATAQSQEVKNAA